jgi:hypothetical protein
VQVVWSLATLGVYEEDLFTAAARGLEKRVGELELPDVAAMAWAFAKAGHPRNSLFDQLAVLVELRHGDFSVRELAQCMWALAACGYKLRFQAELALDEAQLRELKPSEAANLLWALAKLGGPHNEELLRAVCRDIKPKLSTFSPTDLTNTAWALAALGWTEDKVVDYVAGAALRWIGSMSAQQVATIIHSLVRLRQAPAGLLEPLQAEIDRRIASAVDGVKDEDLFHLGRCQELFLAWSRERKEGGVGLGRWRYELGKRALSSLF